MSRIFNKVAEATLASRTGRALLHQAGVPKGAKLHRGRGLPTRLALAAINGATIAQASLASIGVTPLPAVIDTPDARTSPHDGSHSQTKVPPAYDCAVSGLVIDATGVECLGDLEQLRAALRPAMRGIAASGHIVVVGLDTYACPRIGQRTAQHALDGIVRSVAKELRKGAICNLLRLDPQASPDALAAPLRFFLEGRSAFITGQPLAVGATATTPPGYDANAPLAGRIVVVTGAARGIGQAIAMTAARDGSHIVAVDVPAAGEQLARVANLLRGTALQLDITAPDAGEVICAHIVERFGADARIHAVVHNAGITRDRMLAGTDEDRWARVIDVNLAAQLRMNETLLDPDVPGSVGDGGRIVAVSSTSGIAGNRGQTNYAASKSGVIGLVAALSGISGPSQISTSLAQRDITVNAVAPGFIETEMTKLIPPIMREVFRRSNSLAQGGLPQDVAEAICFFADPGSGAVNGQVLRVCGQNLVGQ